MAERPPLLNSLLKASHLIVPDDLPGLVQAHAPALGAREVTIYLADLDQRWLVPLRYPGAPAVDSLPIDTTLAGRSYRAVTVLEGRADNGDVSVSVPLLDGTERLGTLHVTFAPDQPSSQEDLTAFAGLVAELVMTKSAYGDYFERARRTEPLTVAAELLWQLLPPLTFGTDDLVIVAAFLPTARLGGDAFDYGVDGSTARVAIFDALGHDLGAGLLATAAVAAFRNARRSAMKLEDAATHIGRAIADHFDSGQFVTGILTSLDISTGRLSWCVAGHPPPLLLRHGRVVKRLDCAVGLPFGLGPASPVATEQLEAGDRILLYTDGVTEARGDRAGAFFELERLVDLVSRASDNDPPPESMRLLMHAIEEHNDGPIRDDATVVLVEWRGSSASQLKL